MDTNHAVGEQQVNDLGNFSAVLQKRDICLRKQGVMAQFLR